MYARRIVDRHQRWGSVFEPSKYLIRSNCQHHTGSRSLSRTTRSMGNRSPHGSLTGRYLLDLYSTRATAPPKIDLITYQRISVESESSSETSKLEASECSNKSKRLLKRVGNCSSHGGSTRSPSDSFSSQAVVPWNSLIGLHRRPSTSLKNYQLRVYSSTSIYPPKPKEEHTGGTRLNDQINARFVRLVTEEGHKVVSRYEALERARKLKLDLVEVQRNADPPVCKIMDFHKEKYKQQVKDKERAKSKPEMTLRKGDCKEVRLSGKIEQKDLKMKADSVIRLMERGYRVKCMILPNGKDQDVEELLSRFSAMIEDVAVVESGPVIVEKKLKKLEEKLKTHEEPDEEVLNREIKNAYIIVRHVKFGGSKKGCAKKSKVTGITAPKVEKVASKPAVVEPYPVLREDPAELGPETVDEILPNQIDLPISPKMNVRDMTVEDQKTPGSVMNSSDEFTEVFDFNDEVKAPTSDSTNIVKNAAPKIAYPPSNFSVSDTVPSLPPEHSLGTQNRYKRSEPRNQFRPTKSTDNRSSDMELQFPNQRRQSPSNMNASHSMGEKKQFGNAPVFRNSDLPPNSRLKQEPARPDTPNTPTPSYGIFSTPTNGPGNQGAADAYSKRDNNLYDSTRNPCKPGVGAKQNYGGLKSDGGEGLGAGGDNGGKGKWGIFSR